VKGETMPFKPLKPCNHPGCPRLTTAGRCAEHKLKERKRYDDSRGNSGERGYDAQWQKVRRIKLNTNPLCEQHEAKNMMVKAGRVKDGKFYTDFKIEFLKACAKDIG
jgi:5-methylcytosine-specific restriction enzyme A